MKRSFFAAVVIAMFAITCGAHADIVFVDGVSPRNAGPENPDVTFGAGFAANTHAPTR